MPKITTSSMREAADRAESAAQSSQPSDTDVTQDEKKTLSIIDTVGDIFDAPLNSVLIHACNCQGSWGAGIAAAFLDKYPNAYKIYREHCFNSSNPVELRGTALVIPPVDTNLHHYIGCLFTSSHYGRKKDSPSDILRQTEPAMIHLLRQLAARSQSEDIGELRMCQINSGLFRVPWEESKRVLSGIELEDGMPREITVFSLE